MVMRLRRQRPSENVEGEPNPNPVGSLARQLTGDPTVEGRPFTHGLPFPGRGDLTPTTYFPLLTREQNKLEEPQFNPYAPNPMGEALGVSQVAASGKLPVVPGRVAHLYDVEKQAVIDQRLEDEIMAIMKANQLNESDLVFSKKPKNPLPQPSGNLSDY